MRARIEQVPAPYQNEARKFAHEGAVSKAKETGALAPERLDEGPRAARLPDHGGAHRAA